ncbi:MAG: undecaprenyl-phosphate glucose phosphotransferase [Ferruginibacter sp.]
MNRQFIRYMQMSLFGVDLLALNFSFLTGIFFLTGGVPSEYYNQYAFYFSVCNVLWLFLSFASRIYTDKVITIFETFTKASAKAFLFLGIFMLIYLYFFRQVGISRLFVAISLTGFGLGLLFNRFLYFSIKKFHNRYNLFFKKVLIIGYNDVSRKLARYLEEEGVKVEIMGFVDDNAKVEELSSYPVYAGIDKAVEYARQMDVNEIYSTIPPEDDNSLYKIMDSAEHLTIRFKIVPNLSVFINRNVHVDYFNDLPVISLRSHALEDVGNQIKKRALDIIVSTLVIIFILSWLIPLMAILIKLESPGPVFFPQLRTGKNRKDFRCLKFRSMRVNKDADKKQATKNDTRITRIGKFMRRTSLDEFPQFINVFKGEMSLVGPRPHMIKHTDDYSKMVDDYMVRQLLKPGITGWAQINGFRGEIHKPEQIQMRVLKDIWYLENWTLWLDIRIIFLTVYNVVKGDPQAY